NHYVVKTLFCKGYRCPDPFSGYRCPEPCQLNPKQIQITKGSKSKTATGFLCELNCWESRAREGELLGGSFSVSGWLVFTGGFGGEGVIC
ncbi:MAG: hypothetical protein JXD22_11955, partial [Sedimentisphaerales bacterium]|nr:hypothetical protein [Sedimentisphaerales bacterium]